MSETLRDKVKISNTVRNNTFHSIMFKLQTNVKNYKSIEKSQFRYYEEKFQRFV